MTDLKRKFQLLSLDCRIAMLRKAMDREPRPTFQWKLQMVDYLELIRQRNKLRTPAETRKIEKSRGLA